MKNNIGVFLTKRAHLEPAQEALVEVERERRHTYAELNAQTNRVAQGLRAHGIEQGDRVALLLMNGLEYVATYFALAKLGAVVVPLNWRLVVDELEFILNDSGARLLLYDAQFDGTVEALRACETPVRTWVRVGAETGAPEFALAYDRLVRDTSAEEPQPQAEDDDLLLLIYTSGTTGLPKGVMHTHESILWASLTWLLSLDLRPRDRVLIFLPPFHVGVVLPLTLAIHRGCTALLMRSFNVPLIFETLGRERVTSTLAVPTMLQQLVDFPERARYDISSLRWIIVGAAPVPAVLLDRYAGLGIAILQDYGLTESAGPGTIASPEDAVKKPASAGRACFHTELRIVDDSGRELPAGQLGEILLRARHNMKGYWNRPAETADVLRDGWLYTGDLGTVDADGCLYVQDRKKDMIISGGENIYPAELENLLLRHPDIREAAVIGQPSARWGESPAAIIVLREGKRLTPEEVVAFCRGKIASYKLPRVVEFIEALPRTPTSKVQKHLLRQRFPGPAPQ